MNLNAFAGRPGSGLVDHKEAAGCVDIEVGVRVSPGAREGVGKRAIRLAQFRDWGSGDDDERAFLEADRSTENQARFRDKIRAYWHYIDQGLHGRKFGIRNVRVLTVAKTHERAKNLALLAGSLLPERARKYYFFSSLNDFSLQSSSPILEAVHLAALALR